MESKHYWQLFMETGAPEMYLFYNKARKMEAQNVLDDEGVGASGHKLQ